MSPVGGPFGGGEFAAGGTHPADDVAECLGSLPSAEAGFFEDLWDFEVLEGFQCNVFGTHGSGFDLLERVDVNFLEILGLVIPIGQRLELAAAGNDLALNVLGAFFDGGIDRKQGLLGIEDLCNPGAEFRPSFGMNVKIRTQVEQSVLADLLTDSSGFDKTVGEIGATGAVRSRLGLANEHEPRNDQELGFGA